jgi:hypothetical protein
MESAKNLVREHPIASVVLAATTSSAVLGCCILSVVGFRGYIAPPPTPTVLPSVYEQTRALAMEFQRISDHVNAEFSDLSESDISSIIALLEEIASETAALLDAYPNADPRLRKYLRGMRDWMRDTTHFLENSRDQGADTLRDLGMTAIESLATGGLSGFIPFLLGAGIERQELHQEWKELEVRGEELMREREELEDYMRDTYGP